MNLLNLSSSVNLLQSRTYPCLQFCTKYLLNNKNGYTKRKDYSESPQQLGIYALNMGFATLLRNVRAKLKTWINPRTAVANIFHICLIIHFIHPECKFNESTTVHTLHEMKIYRTLYKISNIKNYSRADFCCIQFILSFSNHT